MANKRLEIITWRGHYAGIASRIVAIVLDYLIVITAWALSTTVFTIFYTSTPTLYRLLFGKTMVVIPTIDNVTKIFMIFVVEAFYFIILWTAIGSTIGGVILGVRIVNKRGKNPTFIQATIRFCTEILVPVFGIIGGIWILFDRRRRALFDIIAGTYVIYSWDAKPDEKFLKRETDQITGQGERSKPA